jgi:glutathione S-transferase
LRNSNPAFENRSLPGTNNTPQIGELASRGTDRLNAFYQRLDEQLANNDYVAGNAFSFADISAMCAIDFAEFVGVKPDDSLTNLATWRDVVNSRQSAQA